MAAPLPAAAGAAPRSPLVIDIAADEGAADPWYGMSAGEEAAFLARGSAGAAEDADAEEGGFDTGEKAYVALHAASIFTSRVVSRGVRILGYVLRTRASKDREEGRERKGVGRI